MLARPTRDSIELSKQLKHSQAKVLTKNMQLSNCRNIFLMKFRNFFLLFMDFILVNYSSIHFKVVQSLSEILLSLSFSHRISYELFTILWTENHCGIFHWSLYGRFRRNVGYTCIIFHNRFNRWLKWNLMHRNEYETVFVFCCCCCFNDGWLCIIFHTNNASHAMYTAQL